MIRFNKQEDGLLGAFEHKAKLDWAKLESDIAEMFDETRRTLDQYVPVEPTEEDDTQDSEQETFWGVDFGYVGDVSCSCGDALIDDDSLYGDDLDDVGIAQIDDVAGIE